LKYKQILRDHEVKNTELQQQLDELAKYNEELELKFEKFRLIKIKSCLLKYGKGVLGIQRKLGWFGKI